MKQLTIAVPSYNMEKMLGQCLDSLADARFSKALEVIIVDDGSRDATAEIAQRYVERFPEIFLLVQKENGGHGSAVNTALDRASGRYFRIVDADDWVNTENMERLLKILAGTDADMILDEKTEVDMTTGRETYFSFPESMPSGSTVDFERITADEYRYHMALHTMSVKRELLERHKIRLLEKTFYVDSQFILMATAFVQTALVLRMGIYYYRVGNAAQSVYYLNYVKRYAEHDRVLSVCIDFFAAGQYASARRAFVAHSTALLVHTQYNIALIYNPDRKTGRAQAKKLHLKLKQNQRELYTATNKRYYTALLLNRLGIGYEGLQKIMGRK